MNAGVPWVAFTSWAPPCHPDAVLPLSLAPSAPCRASACRSRSSVVQHSHQVAQFKTPFGYSKLKLEVPCPSEPIINKMFSHLCGLNSLSGIEPSGILLDSCSWPRPHLAPLAVALRASLPLSSCSSQEQIWWKQAVPFILARWAFIGCCGSPALLAAGGTDLFGSQNGCSFPHR